MKWEDEEDKWEDVGEPFGKLVFDETWSSVGKIPDDDKERLAFYDKLFFEAWKREIKLEVIILNINGFEVVKKMQITTYHEKPLG